MKVRLERHENGWMLVIPDKVAQQLRWSAGTDLEMFRVGDSLTVSLAGARKTLDEMLEGMTEENRHDEVRTGAPVGREAW